MNIGFKATLFAGVITFGAMAPAFAAAPVMSNLPDIAIGDMEDGADNNLFVYSDAFNFDDYVTDADTASNQLLWSFAEFDGGLDAAQYTINGVGPINVGDQEIADEQLAGNPKAAAPGANQINASSSSATFRDIILSPGTGSGPFADPSPADADTAAQGKAIRYYVADPEGNVAFKDAFISTVDNGFDMLTEAEGWTEIFRDNDFSDEGWEPSAGPSPAVTWTKEPGKLNIHVQAQAATSRYAGWKHTSLVNYDDVGAGKYLHGKFYIYASNSIFLPGSDVPTPINQIPGFRLRLSNEDAQQTAVHFEYGQTGVSGPAHEPRYALFNNEAAEFYSLFLRPTDRADRPSLYKVDFDPVDVPAAAGTNIGALFESYTQNDPADGTLTLAEVVLGTYDELSDAEGDLVFEYDRSLGLAGGVGGAKTMTGGPFNAENNFEPGRLRALQFQGQDASTYASHTDQGANGIFMTTAGTPDNWFGIDIMNLEVSDVNRVRIEQGKLYRARYYATAGLPTSSANPEEEVQANLVFRFQTVSNTLSYRTEVNSTAIQANATTTKAISEQVLPGIGSQNPETDASLDFAGEAGGWYTVLVSSPLDREGIRADYGSLFPDHGGFFFIDLDPGPGETGDSTRDVALGVDLLSGPRTLVLSPGLEVPFTNANRAEVRISAIKVFEYPALDDGGYDFGAGN